MAERIELQVIANIDRYVKPLSELPGVTKANAEKAAIALATSLGKVEGAAAEATAKVQAFNKSLIEQGVSEKAAAAASLKYAQSLATAGTATQQVSATTTTLGTAAGSTAEKAGNLSQALTAVGQQGQDMAVQLQMGTSPVTVMLQQFPQLATQLSMAGYSMGALASAALPVALVLGTLVAGYSVYANAAYDAERANLELAISFDGTLAAAQKMQAAQNAVAEAHKSTTDSVTKAALELAVQTGQLKDYEVAAGDAARAVVDGAADERQARQELNATMGARLEILRRAIAADETDSSQKPKLIQQEQQLAAAYRENIRELRTLEEETALLSGAVGTATVEAGKAKEAEDAATKARQAHEKAIRAQEEALRKLSQAMQAENDEAERTQRAYQGAIDAINGIERAQKQATASEGERIDMAYAATLDTIAAEERKAMAVSNSVAATETIQQEGERARRAARAAYVQELAKLDEKRNENAAKSLADMEADQKASADRMRSMWTSVNGAIGDTFNTMTGAIISSASTAAQEAGRAIADLQGQIDDITKVELTHAEIAELEGEALVKAYKDGQVAAKDLTNDQRRQLATSLQMEQNAQKLRQEQAEKAAMTAYKVQKGAALASTLINAGLQVSNAAAAIPYPANIPGVVAATIMGAAQVAAVAASPPPKFHAGSLSAGPGPGSARRGNEFTAVLEGGEAVIPRATMQQPGAKEQAAALVSGRSPVAADEVAKGMDRSSIPYYLEQLVRHAKKPAQRTRNTRPGHKPRYGAE